jgi:hypothetical protein
MSPGSRGLDEVVERLRLGALAVRAGLGLGALDELCRVLLERPDRTRCCRGPSWPNSGRTARTVMSDILPCTCRTSAFDCSIAYVSCMTWILGLLVVGVARVEVLTAFLPVGEDHVVRRLLALEGAAVLPRIHDDRVALGDVLARELNNLSRDVRAQRGAGGRTSLDGYAPLLTPVLGVVQDAAGELPALDHRLNLRGLRTGLLSAAPCGPCANGEDSPPATCGVMP